MDMSKREKELANQRFAREELGALLKLFSALGITVALGILGFFLLGLWLDRYLTGLGWHTRNIPKIGCLLLGVALSIYWAYLRIARHLDKYEITLPGTNDDPESPENNVSANE